jgi:hypothetical protein
MNRLALSFFELGRQQEALALLEEVLQLAKARYGSKHPTTAAHLYDIACLHARLIATVADREIQAAVAMDWLRQAVAAGYKNVAHMKEDKDLDPLREREDFKKLMQELENPPTNVKP